MAEAHSQDKETTKPSGRILDMQTGAQFDLHACEMLFVSLPKKKRKEKGREGEF